MVNQIARFVFLAGAMLLGVLVFQPAPGVGAVAAEAGGVPVPSPPKGRGEKCVAETSYIRRYHMNLLSHQRDDTVHEGIRTKQFSLKECVDCHAVKGADSKPVAYDDPSHFCRSCHDYAAVAIDCFECHDSKPQKSAATGEAFRGALLALEGYLKARKP